MLCVKSERVTFMFRQYDSALISGISLAKHFLLPLKSLTFTCIRYAYLATRHIKNHDNYLWSLAVSCDSDWTLACVCVCGGGVTGVYMQTVIYSMFRVLRNTTSVLNNDTNCYFPTTSDTGELPTAVFLSVCWLKWGCLFWFDLRCALRASHRQQCGVTVSTSCPYPTPGSLLLLLLPCLLTIGCSTYLLRTVGPLGSQPKT